MAYSLRDEHEVLNLSPQHPHRKSLFLASVSPTVDLGNRGIPGTHWPDSLAESMSSRVHKGPCLKSIRWRATEEYIDDLL